MDVQPGATDTTPFLAMDLSIVSTRYRELVAALPQATVLYAVKANPARRVIRRLRDAGSNFDVASPGEIRTCLSCGIEPHRLAYGNTIKKEADIAFAYRCGVRTFTIDSAAELEKVIRHAPESTVYVRICTDGSGADWPLSRKFGCRPVEALELIRRATRRGLGFGVAFHVGSQQHNPRAWDQPLEEVAWLFEAMRREGHEPAGVNLGGGFPSTHREPTPRIEAFGAAISRALQSRLGSGFAGRVFVEPGRYLVGDAGVIEAEVVLISRRSPNLAQRWVYLDIGLFNGLTETLEEAIHYRIVVPGRTGPPAPVVLAGPTCDSADVLYERYQYELPSDLRIGDRVQILSAGAYTASYSSVGFNGFQPLRTIFMPAPDIRLQPLQLPRSRVEANLVRVP